MAELLIKRSTGVIVWVAEDGHTWGLRESIDSWKTAGRDPASFPTDLIVIKRPGDSYSAWKAHQGEKYRG